MRYQAAVEQFFNWLAPRKLAATTRAAYGQDLDVIAQRVGSLDKLNIDQLDRLALRTAFADYSVDHSKASILRAHSTWRQFFDFLVADGLTEGSPMAAIARPKADERQPRPLEGWAEDTVTQLLTALADGKRPGRNPWPHLDVAVVATLLATGARRSELLAMNLDALEGRAGEQVIRVVGKGAKPRTIPVEEGLDQVLGGYLESRKARFPDWKAKPGDALFVSAAKNERLNARQLHYLLEQSLVAAGLASRRHKGAMAHAFRHTYGTTLAADGAPVAAIRKLMGHSSINTSQGYIDSLARDERTAAARNRVYDVLDGLSKEG